MKRRHWGLAVLKRARHRCAPTERPCVTAKAAALPSGPHPPQEAGPIKLRIRSSAFGTSNSHCQCRLRVGGGSTRNRSRCRRPASRAERPDSWCSQAVARLCGVTGTGSLLSSHDEIMALGLRPASARRDRVQPGLDQHCCNALAKSTLAADHTVVRGGHWSGAGAQAGPRPARAALRPPARPSRSLRPTPDRYLRAAKHLVRRVASRCQTASIDAVMRPA